MCPFLSQIRLAYLLISSLFIHQYIYTHTHTHTRLLLFGSRDNSVGIALGYGLDDRGSRVRIPARAGHFSLHHRYVQNGSGVHPTSYPMGTRCSVPGGKAAGAWSWPLRSN